MSHKQLRTAVLGLNEAGRILLKAAADTNILQLQAVADEDSKLAESLGANHRCAYYDDYRQLIIQEQLDCLLVGSAIHKADEYIKMAMKKKVHILKTPPLARNFAEAAELVDLAEEQGLQFAVANTNRFAQSFLEMRKFFQQTSSQHAYLISAVCHLGQQPQAGWQTDEKLAGGGVLLHDCYEIIDQILWNFGTPQQVYSLKMSLAPDKQQRLYLTEDVAIATMKFTDTCLAIVTAMRNYGPEQKLLKIYTKDRVLSVSENVFCVNDLHGKKIEESEHDDSKHCRMAALLENFAMSILDADKIGPVSRAKENLANMAVVEAAYLSSRTAMPEQPAKISRMATTARP